MTPKQLRDLLLMAIDSNDQMPVDTLGENALTLRVLDTNERFKITVTKVKRLVQPLITFPFVVRNVRTKKIESRHADRGDAESWARRYAAQTGATFVVEEQ